MEEEKKEAFSWFGLQRQIEFIPAGNGVRERIIE
jgi:hypothetical protein